MLNKHAARLAVIGLTRSHDSLFFSSANPIGWYLWEINPGYVSNVLQGVRGERNFHAYAPNTEQCV